MHLRRLSMRYSINKVILELNFITVVLSRGPEQLGNNRKYLDGIRPVGEISPVVCMLKVSSFRWSSYWSSKNYFLSGGIISREESRRKEAKQARFYSAMVFISIASNHRFFCAELDYEASVTIFLKNMASQGDGENTNSMGRILKALSTLHPSINASIDCFSKRSLDILRSYEKLVLEDPEKLSRIESALTFISFVLPGNFRSSDVISELVYFATKMMTLLHDIIYRKKVAEMHSYLWTHKTYFQAVLTVIEYTEAFLELGATRLWGDPGKWLVIFALQILKATLKVVLLFYFRSGMQHSPSLLFVREKVRQQELNEMAHENGTFESAWKEANSSYEKFEVWSGKRSGRVVRSLKSVPPKGFRDWKLPNKQNVREEEGVEYFRSNDDLTKKEKLAELAYILRPIGHLLAMFVYGEKSWKPWLLSLAVDVNSLRQLQLKGTLQKYEKDEILRRKATLLVYLLRSPFYDNYSRSKILLLLEGSAKWIPGLKLVSVPLKEYLPVWQKIYSHNWST